MLFFSLIRYFYVFIINIFYIPFHNNLKELIDFSHFMVIELNEFIFLVEHVLEFDILQEFNCKYDEEQMFF